MSVKRLADEDFNKNLTYWFNKFVNYKKEPVIYDIGANWGIFSLKFCKKAKQVYSFEPVSNTFKTLLDNIENEEANNIKPFKIGLSDKRQDILIHKFDNNAFDSFYKRSNDEISHYSLRYSGTEIVSVVSLDNFVEEQNLLGPDIVKIDIEGAELYALSGARKTISKNMPFMIVEFSIDNTFNAGYDRMEIIDELHQYDYSIYGLLRSDDIKLYKNDHFTDKGIWNIVCIPNECIDIIYDK